MMSAEIPFLRDSTTSKTRALCDAQVDVTHERTRTHKYTLPKHTHPHTQNIRVAAHILDEFVQVDVTHISTRTRTHTYTYTHNTHVHTHTQNSRVAAHMS